MRTKKLFFAAVAAMLCALMIVAAPVAYARDYTAQKPDTSTKTEIVTPCDGSTVKSDDVILEGDDIIKAKEDQAIELNIHVEDISKIKEIYFEVSSEEGKDKFKGACVRYLMNNTNEIGKLKTGWNKIQFILHKSTGLASSAGDAKSKSFNTRYSFYLGGGMTGNVDYNNIIYLRLCVKAQTGGGETKVSFAGNDLNEAITLIDKPDQSYVPELDSSVPDVSSNASSKGGYLLTPSTAASSEEAASSEVATSAETTVTSEEVSSVASETEDEGGSFPWWIIIVVVAAVAVAGVAVVLVIKKKKA